MPGAEATSSNTISDQGADEVASIVTSVPTILFLPPFRVQDDVQKWYLKVHKHMRDWIGV